MKSGLLQTERSRIVSLDSLFFILQRGRPSVYNRVIEIREVIP
ncbi:hypothetical protein SAMN05880570_3007 [Paenibacillus sp. RU4T]|nr:hypothetical protein SAMN05880555_2993 [Paenibacillus sp. RU4X]SIR27315.1 hypothetical protein SAMN05880570_3007 [Paenibacillus sp. RU4T]